MTTDPLEGTTIAGYRIINRLGQGGLGTVYRAYEISLDRDLALKLMRPDVGRDATWVERFKREMYQAAQVNHNSIVTILQAGRADGHLFIAMRLIPGDNLGHLIAEGGRLGEARVARLVGQVGGALQAVHEHGSVHRDVKPLNILVERPGQDDEHAFLADFGLAKALSAAGGPTGAFVIGTDGYIAPEVWLGKPPGPAADQYSLACSVYQALSGRLPFEPSGDVDAYRNALFNDPPPSLPHVSPDVANVLFKGLAKRPDDRHANVRGFVSELWDAVGSSIAPPSSVPSFGAVSDSQRVGHGEEGAALVDFVDANAPGIVYINIWLHPDDFPEIKPEGDVLAARTFTLKDRHDEPYGQVFTIEVDEPAKSQFTYSGGTGWRLRGYFALKGVVAARMGFVHRALEPVSASLALTR